MTINGIPLIYLGDEIGTLNDYSYRKNPIHERDSRWVHRPRADWEKYEKRNNPASVEGRVFQGMKRLIALRKEHNVFGGNQMEVIQTGNEHVLGFIRQDANSRVVIFANFSDFGQRITKAILYALGIKNINTILLGTPDFSRDNLHMSPLDFLVMIT